MSAEAATGAAPPQEPAAAEHAAVQHRVHILSLQGKAGELVPLPLAFSSPVRRDLIRRAVVAARSHRIQPHGTSPTAGRRHSVEWSGKGRGVARTPRLMGGMTGAQAPNTVGGGAAHPPQVNTIWAKKINRSERQAAFAAALAATRDPALARGRGHTFPETLHLPVVLENSFEAIDSTAAARTVLAKLKLWDDVDRAQAGVHVRAGRGKRRGRYRRGPKSLLIVVSAPRKARGFRNLSGVDVVDVGRLGPEDLAPGGDPGRLTLFSAAAVERLKGRLEGAAQ
jgi:large subunit ribosomal protein L4e